MSTSTKANVAGIPVKALNVVHCASKDPMRHHLNGIYIKPGVAYASDGKTLAKVKWNETQGEEFQGIVHKDQVKNVIQTKAQYAAIHGDQEIEIHGQGIKMGLNEIHGQFPDCDSIIPENASLAFRVNPFVLKQALEAMIKVNGFTNTKSCAPVIDVKIADLHNLPNHGAERPVVLEHYKASSKEGDITRTQVLAMPLIVK